MSRTYKDRKQKKRKGDIRSIVRDDERIDKVFYEKKKDKKFKKYKFTYWRENG